MITAIPRVGAGKKQMKKTLSGEIPSPINPPSGCTFHPRCPYKMDICTKSIPELKNAPDTSGVHQAACWLVNPESNKQ
ncbi:MAG: oligopeptide/dipeptide ABC transporter ATP-binding protein [Pseudobdellovibrionaceae bacterium]